MFLVVAGSGSGGPMSSTEILVKGSNSWQTIASLPIKGYGMRTVSVGNTILYFGNFYHKNSKSSRIHFL